MARYIPEKHYIGFQHRGEGCKLGFMTPYGTNSAAKKRMSTVDNWINGWGRDEDKKPIKAETFINEGMFGFKIGESVRRWSTQNVLWRIEDPRGFELEISSGNMAYIIANTSIINGEITDKLIWCRDGSQNYLLPLGSEEHQTYTENTNAVRVKVGDLSPGDVILLNNSYQHTYLGKYTFVFGALPGFAMQYDVQAQPITGTKRIIVLKDENGKFVGKASLPKTTSLVTKGVDKKDYSEEIYKDVDYYGNTFSAANIKHVCKNSVSSVKVAATLKIVETETPIQTRRYSIYDRYLSYSDDVKADSNFIFIRNKSFGEVGSSSTKITQINFDIGENKINYTVFHDGGRVGFYNGGKLPPGIHRGGNYPLTKESQLQGMYAFEITVNDEKVLFA